MTFPVSGDTPSGVSGTTVVNVSRSVSKPVNDIWKSIVSPTGAAALLGPGAVLGDKGDGWRSDDGKYGVIRSYHPLEEIRFSWYASEGAPKTMVKVLLCQQTQTETLIEIIQDQVPEYFDTAALVKRWETAIEALIAAVG
ncbi:MAG: SRPBCC domain-containing protein [Propionibacteriaceae bacterium]|nr:SRPBCC domain-containing protein [Propionibacteriaceae bacterium]